MLMETRQARVAIVGGGVMGCSLAYHLCKEGWTELDVMVLGASRPAHVLVGPVWDADNIRPRAEE